MGNRLILPSSGFSFNLFILSILSFPVSSFSILSVFLLFSFLLAFFCFFCFYPHFSSSFPFFFFFFIFFLSFNLFFFSFLFRHFFSSNFPFSFMSFSVFSSFSVASKVPFFLFSLFFSPCFPFFCPKFLQFSFRFLFFTSSPLFLFCPFCSFLPRSVSVCHLSSVPGLRGRSSSPPGADEDVGRQSSFSADPLAQREQNQRRLSLEACVYVRLGGKPHVVYIFVQTCASCSVILPTWLTLPHLYINSQASAHLSDCGGDVMGEISERGDGKGRHEFCQMPFVNKQGVLRGAPSGVLTRPSRRTQSGCPPYLV